MSTNNVNNCQVLVIAGPSGVGKSTLIKQVMEKRPGWIFSISATTRRIRDGEQDGREYHFLSLEEFEKKIFSGELLEYANVYGNLYGTPASELDRASSLGKHLLIEIDTVGCLSIRSLRPEIPLIAILPPDLATLRKRLSDRGTETPESLEARLCNSVAELQRMRSFDFAIVNDDLDTATQQLADLLAVLEGGVYQTTPRVDHVLHEAGGSK